MDILDISISGPAAQVQALLTSIASRPAEPRQASTPAPLLADHPRIGEPWPGIPGSAYAGIARGRDGEGDGHLVLLADKPTADLAWQAAIDWAKSLGDGARLPTRFESALLYANLQDQLDTSRYHWTGSQYSADGAWFQGFDDGYQFDGGESYEARARAVRRFAA